MKKEKGSYYGKGHGDFAGMPKEVEMKAYPKAPGPKREGSLDDTMTGVDSWNRQMEGKRSRFVSDQH